MSAVAADVMTTPAIVVGPQASLAAIVGLLADHAISAVPVCDAQGRLLGLVSEGDILRPIRAEARTRREWWLGLLSEGEALAPDFLDYIRHDNRTAADVMVREVITAGADATLAELAELMVQHGIKRVPIIRDDHVIGIASRADLLAAIARAPSLLE